MNEYEITIRVEGMQFPEIGTVTIAADTPKEAKQWAEENITLTAKRV